MKTNRTSTPATKTKSRTPGRILSASIAALLAVAAVPQGARAASVTWNHGSVVNNNWSNGGVLGNWFTSAAPVNGDDVFFDNGLALSTTNTNDIVGLSLNSISFNNAPNGTYTLNGNAITLGAGGLTNNTPGVTQTISLAGVTLGAGQTWLAFNGNLAVTSTVNLNGQGLIVAGDNNTTISNAISGAGAASTLTKNGTGTLTLSGGAANTFAGLTNVTNGTLQLNNGANDGAIAGNLTIGDNVGAAASAEVRWLQSAEVANTSAIIINSDGRMNLNSFTETVGSISGSAGGQIDIGGGALTTGGNNTTTNYAGVITGGGNLSKNGTGTWTLTGANNYSATTFVNAGILEAGNNSALGTTAGNTLVNNGGTLRLLHGVNIGAEALGLVGAGADGANGALAVAAGGTASYAGLITLNGSSTITANGGTLTLTGGIVKNGVTLTFGTSTSGGGTANVNSVISGAAASSDLVVESMTVNLGAANTYNGPTFIRSSGGFGTGILNANAAGALPDPLFGAPARSVLTMDDVGLGGSVLNLNGSFGQVVASLTGAASSIVNLNTSTLTIGTAAGTTTFAGTINGLAGAGNVSIVKDGASTQVFSGPNTYLGLTNVDAGTLRLGNASALGNTGLGTNVASGATLDLNGQNIGVEAISITGIGTGAAIGALNNSSGTAASLAGILTVVSSASVGGAGNISLDGKVTGGLLTKVGAGTVFLTNNANDYNLTSITTGILQVGGATVGGGSTGVLGSGTVLNQATLNFNRNNALVVGNDISGSGAVNQNGIGITSLNGANSYDGATTVNAGTLRLGNATALGSTVGGTTMLAGATIDLNGQAVGAEAVGIAGNGDAANLQIAALTNNGVATATLAGQLTLIAAATVGSNAGNISLDGGIAGAFGLTKVGTDTVFITSSINGSTTTTITGGNLQVGGSTAGGTAAGALGSGAVTNNSILTFNRNNAITVANVIGGTGVLNQIGSSAASVTTLSGANTYTGQTNVNAGTLQLGNATALGSALSGTVVASGATLDLNGQAVGGEAVAIAGTGVGGNGALTNTNLAASSLAGPLALTAAASVGGNAGAISLDGAVTGSALTKVGTNTVVLTNNGNSYTTTTISAGILQVGAGGTSGVLGGGAVTNNATLNFIRSDTFTVSNTIGGSGVVNQNGIGTTNLSGPNTYTGLTTVNAGVLEVQNNTALGTAAAGTTVAAGTTLRLANGIVIGTAGNAEAITINGNGTGAAHAQGALTVVAGGTATFNGTIIVASASTIHANGGTLNFNEQINKTDNTLTLTGGGIVNVNGGIIGDNDNAFNDDLVINGTTANLNSNNTYEGPTTINSTIAGNGVVNANVAGALPTFPGRSAVTMDNAGAGGSTLNIGGSTGFPLGSSQAIASLVGTSTSKVTLGANKLTVGFGTGINTNGTANANFAGVISGTGSITKDDTSTQILSGLNTYTGETRVTGGTLRAGSTQAFGVNSATFVGNGAVLDLAGNDNVIGSLSDIGGVGGTVRSTINDAELSVGGGDQSGSFAGLIENGVGPLTLRKIGTGIQSLAGNNTYTGDTFLDEGGLFANVAPGATTNTAFGTGTLHIAGGTTLGSTVGNETIANNINVNGDFSVAPVGNNANRLNLTGNVNVGFGNTITNIGPVGEVEMTGVTSGGSVTFAAGGALGGFVLGDLQNPANPQNALANTFTGPMTVDSNAGVALAKNDGVLALPGDAVINAGGTLALFANNQIADTSTITVNSSGNSALGATFGGFFLNGKNETISSLFGTGTVQLDNVPTGGATAGTLTVGSGNFSGVIFDNNNGGRLVKNTPGNLILSGASTYTGSTNVQAGNLIVNGSLRSSVFVQLGAALAGIGSTTRNVVNGGTFSPGTGGSLSVGKFNIGGNYNQTAGGTLVVDIAGRFPGQSDLVAVQGTANLNGTLRLVNVGGTKLKVGDKITFLTANNGVNGEFANEINPFSTSGTIVTTEVVYHANYVSLEAKQGSFAEFGLHCSANGQAVGRALDKLVASGRNEKLINLLNGVLLTDLCHDLDLIAPEELQAMYSVGFSHANVQTANLSRRMDDLRSGAGGFSASGYSVSGMEPQYSANYLAANQGLAGPQGKVSKEMRPPIDNTVGFFATGSGEFTDIGSTNNARGYNLSSAGFTLGVDYRVNENFAIGVNVGYARTNADIAGGGKINTDSMKLGLYATYFRDGFYVDGAVQGGYNTYDTRRAALRGSATGSTDGTDFNAHLAFGYDWRRGGLTVGPTASLQYTRVGFDGFAETGSQAALTYSSQSADSLRSALGMKASYEIHAGTVIIKPEVRAAWQHEFGDGSYGIQSQISNGGAGFNVQGAEIGSDSLLLGAGVAVLWNERTATYVYYDGELGRSNYQSNNVSGGLRLEF